MVEVDPPDHSVLTKSNDVPTGEEGEEGSEFSVSWIGEMGGDWPVEVFSLRSPGGEGGTGMDRRDSLVSVPQPGNQN